MTSQQRFGKRRKLNNTYSRGNSSANNWDRNPEFFATEEGEPLENSSPSPSPSSSSLASATGNLATAVLHDNAGKSSLRKTYSAMHEQAASKSGTVDEDDSENRHNVHSSSQLQNQSSFSMNSQASSSRRGSRATISKQLQPANENDMDVDNDELLTSNRAKSENTRSMPSRLKKDDNAPGVGSAGDVPSTSSRPSDITTSSESSHASGPGPAPISSPPTSIETVNNDDSSRPSESQIPSYDEQVETVTSLVQREEQKEGLVGFLVSMKWLDRIKSRTVRGLNEAYTKSLREGEVGAVDNKNLLPNSTIREMKDGSGHDFVSIRPGLRIGEDFEVLSEAAWKLVQKWYGIAPGSPIITRYLHNTTGDAFTENFQYEIYPVIFIIQKLRLGNQGRGLDSLKNQDKRAPRLVASRSEGYQHFLQRAKASVGIDNSKKVQTWKIVETLAAETGRAGIPTPMSSRSASPMPQASPAPDPYLEVDLNTLTSMVEGTQRELIEIQDETANTKYNGHLTLSTVGFPETQTLILEEQIRDGENDEFLTNKSAVKSTSASTTSILGKAPNTALDRKLKSFGENGRISPAPTGMVTRGRANANRRATVGLQNLGNTCYMNSALQCIRSVKELTFYFLAQNYLGELNPKNPLGHGGQIAKAYAGLITAMHDQGKSFTPRNFKNVLGRAQPLFSGYGQQDSQEFLSFLIDGLHEDLNRIEKKPYIENPDSDDKLVHDPEYIRQLGEKFRFNHKQRNDSVAMDLFTGFYKNTMHCPVCSKVSVTFDPFTQVTLQLPVERTWQHTIKVIRLNTIPCKVDVDTDKGNTFRGMKDYIAKRMPGIRAENLVIAEEYSSKIYKVFEDSETLDEANIQRSDKICAYELDSPPTNWPPIDKKKPKTSRFGISFSISSNTDSLPGMESQFADRIAVPLIHRLKDGTKSNPVLWPSFILLSREEAKNSESIHRKVLQRIATMTTRDLICEDDYSSQTQADTVDESMHNITNGDETNGEDAKIKVTSVEGDDDLVDISMNDNAISNQPAAPTDEPRSPRSKRISRILNSQVFIEPEVRNSFSIMIHPQLTDIVPVNYGGYAEGSKMVSLESRIPERTDRRASSSSWRGKAPGRRWGERDSPQSSDDELAGGDHSIDSANHSPESSDDDQSLPTPLTPPRGQGRMKKFGAKIRTYSRKNRKDRQRSKSRGGPEDDYLIRLGEGLIIEWSEEGFKQLFDGTDEQDFRGQCTETLIQTVPDPDLEERRARRNARKKNGVTLEECFSETAKEEILSEENSWYCNRCKELRRASKTLDIWTAPDILVAHLKRFASQSRMRDKVDVLVDFPIEGLDLSGKVGLPQGKSLIYDLFAVDNHYGGLGGGHYTAYAKNIFDSQWYEYNDSTVLPVNENHLVSSAAYLLFYRRRTEGFLGPQYFEDAAEDYLTGGNRTSSPPEGEVTSGSAYDTHSKAVDVSALNGPLAIGNHTESAPQEEPFNDFITSHEDEGISMNVDDENNPGSFFIGPLRQEPGWDFSAIKANTSRRNSDASDAAAASNTGSLLDDGEPVDQFPPNESPTIMGESVRDSVEPGGSLTNIQPYQLDDPAVHNIKLDDEGTE